MVSRSDFPVIGSRRLPPPFSVHKRRYWPASRRGRIAPRKLSSALNNTIESLELLSEVPEAIADACRRVPGPRPSRLERADRYRAGGIVGAWQPGRTRRRSSQRCSTFAAAMDSGFRGEIDLTMCRLADACLGHRAIVFLRRARFIRPIGSTRCSRGPNTSQASQRAGCLVEDRYFVALLREQNYFSLKV